ncbi:MAG: AMP-binding protein, partial [Chloroflexota bacterium]
MIPIAEGIVLWEPPEALMADCALTHYARGLEARYQTRFPTYGALWQWSVEHIDAFWQSIAEFFDVHFPDPYTLPVVQGEMPGARWFSGATINYAEQAFRQASSEYPAIVFKAEGIPLREVSWVELERSVGATAAALRDRGVRAGDRVAAYLPNIPEAVVTFLACASIGAVWSSCSPDMGSAGVIDRFAQIEPKVLFVVDGYRYGGKEFDRIPVVTALRAALPTVEHVVLVPYLHPDSDGAV